MLDNPSLLQELPDIAALLPQGGGDREQAAAADRILAGLDAVTELALNHRLAQSTFCGVVGGLDRLDLQPSRYGPLLSALVGLLRSAFPLSFSKTQALLQLLVGVEMSCGTIATIRRRLSAALAQSMKEALAAARQQPLA